MKEPKEFLLPNGAKFAKASAESVYFCRIRSLLRNRFSTLFSIGLLYLILSFFTRISFLIWSLKDVVLQPVYLLRAFFTGFLFDLTVALSFLFLYAIYLLLFPKRWIGSLTDKIFTYLYLSIVLIVLYFGLIAEFPFWEEFGVRFNFIAVDYLIYTYEVVANINQSYSLPLIIGLLATLVIATFFLLHKTGVLKNTFSDKRSIRIRAIYTISILATGVVLLIVLKNKMADFSNNLVINEIGKNGVFSLFAAYRSNELDYDTFYATMNQRDAYSVLKKNLLQENQNYTTNQWDDIKRATKGGVEIHPNIILITIESFSADFLGVFGNENNLTPNYDSLADRSIFFTDLYATGTRTVRGMEALTLCVPPTPGNSIVRRPDNSHIFSIATILRQRNYHSYFVYGGDGYFDNMNNFFGEQGFDIVDRNRGNPLSDKIETHRYNIPDSEVTFENAWGVCDEDLYHQVIKYADNNDASHTPFFQFVMTTSNHRPFSFPDGKIDLPKGNRNAAVKYTDFALGKFIREAQTKPWFKNTVFVIVADHCAGSAGKWEINIDKHHIPAIIYNLPHTPQKINRLVSQIDLIPTLFGYLNWTYHTEFYGKDINQVKIGEERAFIGNYRTLGVLKGDMFTQIDDRKGVKQFRVPEEGQSLTEEKTLNNKLANETISYYQTSSERFKSGKMKE